MINYILIPIVLIVLGHFMFILKKNQFRLNSSFNWYKNKFFGTVIEKTIKNSNSNNIKNRSSSKFKIKESNKETDLSEILPFNVEDTGNLSDQERELRIKLIEKVKKKPAFFYENGEKKIIVPLESIVFLNNDFNPLVNESGEIIIRIDETSRGDKKEFKIYSEDSGEVYLEQDPGVRKSLEDLGKIVKNSNVSLDEIHSMVAEKIKENDSRDKKVESVNDKVEEEKFEISLPEDLLEDLDMEVEDGVSSKQEIPSIEDIVSDIEVGNEKKDNEKVNEFSVEDIVDEISVESNEIISENKEESIKDFLYNKEWSYVSESKFNWRDIEGSLKNVLTGDNLSKFYANIVKHKLVIMNDNKTAIFIDNIILYNSISHLFGNDHKNIMTKFSKMPPKIFNSYKKTLVEILENDLFDINREKSFGVAIFQEGGRCFKGFGLWIILDRFRIAFDKSEEFDFFRSFPLSSNYKVSDSKTGCVALISSADNIEI